MFTNQQLAAFCLAVHAAKWVYWYGTCGYKTSKSLYNAKKKQYKDHYTLARESGYMKDIANGKMCADCVGMIKAFFWLNGKLDGKNVYQANGCPDRSANGMFELCRKTGQIETIPDIPGLAVWKPGHIGVYVGGGIVVEMNGFANDCLKRKVSANTWQKWGMLPASMLEYVDGAGAVVAAPATVAYVLGERELKNGRTGDDVRELQERLIALGYDCGRWGIDGDFGDATEMALRAFQKERGLIVDGVAGKDTYAALNDAMDALRAQQPATPALVEIRGGNCYVRVEPNINGAIMGVALQGRQLEYLGQTSEDGWQKVKFKDQEGWVSGKYGKLVG